MTILHITSLIGVCAMAMSAAILGMRHRLDIFGIVLLGTTAALGGGNIRDVLLNHHPISWVADPWLLLYVLGASLSTVFLARHVHRIRRLFLTADAIGLVAFSVGGCNVGLELGVPWIVVLLAGMITGVFGGMLRDILTNEVPLVLCRDLYATVAFVTGAVYVLQLKVGIDHNIAIVASLVFGFALRMLALRLGWALPGFSDDGVRGFE